MKDSKKPDRVRFAYGKTINMGDFNSTRLDVGQESNVQEGETANEAMERVKKFVMKHVEKESRKFDSGRWT